MSAAPWPRFTATATGSPTKPPAMKRGWISISPTNRSMSNPPKRFPTTIENMQTTFLLDKQFEPDLGYALGKIGVRVVVFPKRKDKTQSVESDVPLDLQAEEDFSPGDSEVNGYLEFPKRGKMCCVFLVNGQRHHGLDNSFIVRSEEHTSE